MPQSISAIHAHIVFHKKTQSPPIAVDHRARLWAYIAAVANSNGAVAIQVGGTDNHVHLLCALPKNMAPAEFVQKVKAASSKWIKTLPGLYDNFYWQGGYGMFGVGRDHLPTVKRYIINQEEHHKTVSARDELLGFLEYHDIEVDREHLLDE